MFATAEIATIACSYATQDVSKARTSIALASEQYRLVTGTVRELIVALVQVLRPPQKPVVLVLPSVGVLVILRHLPRDTSLLQPLIEASMHSHQNLRSPQL